MAKFELKLPKMGESVAEATIINWLKDVGDTIEIDDVILEIATDKVDSEVPSEVNGILVEKCFDADTIVQVGQTIAILEIEAPKDNTVNSKIFSNTHTIDTNIEKNRHSLTHTLINVQAADALVASSEDRFYSPLVKNIAKEEQISQSELDAIEGSGKNGRVTKNDIKNYITARVKGNASISPPIKAHNTLTNTTGNTSQNTTNKVKVTVAKGEDEIIEMTRMGKLISKHMTNSLQTSAHVQSFIEVDVTNIWNWRNNHKEAFQQRTGEKLTFTPIFMEAIAKALVDFPMMNISVGDDKIIVKKHINLGMATALPDGNLIVPVIKDADQLNLIGMAKKVNHLALKARQGELTPDDVQDGTYTVTNVGTFGSLMGTPIINQPQVGILAIGVIRKVPAVIETPQGDFIGIRHKLFLSHSYDHRVVNGALGGYFVKAVKDYLEVWDMNRSF